MAHAYGKLILFGEHAVVHGQPAIAVPLRAVQVTVTAEQQAKGHGTCIHFTDTNDTICLDDADDAFAAPLQQIFKHLGLLQQPDILLNFASSIPIASGMGSGAAIAKAIIEAVAVHLHGSIDEDTLNTLVYEVERIHHGQPSGIDNTVIVYERPVYFQRQYPIQFIEISAAFTVLVAFVGHTTPTYITVGDVKKRYEAEPETTRAIFERIGAIVRQARSALQVADTQQLGYLMNANQALLQALDVSDETLNRLCNAATAAGAAGAKLSGGGRGGNMIALVDSKPSEKQVTTALLKAGATRVVSTTIGSAPA